MMAERPRTGTSSRIGRLTQVFFAAILTLACGARSSGDDEVGTSGGSSKAGRSQTPSKAPESPSGSGGTKGGAGGFDPNSPLGPCVPGFKQEDEPDRPCNWFADGLCYDDKHAACSCVCPRDRKSICASPSYKGDGNRTPVNCF
ncbi:MAG: hypothetical protein DIU78_007510 [Pseudomonadota bacterium]